MSVTPNGFENAMKPLKCSVCGKLWAWDDLTRARQHVSAKIGKCRNKGATLLRVDVEFRASDRSVGGRQVTSNLSEGVPYDLVDHDTDTGATDASIRDTDASLEADISTADINPAIGDSDGLDSMMEILDLLVTEGDVDKISMSFNSASKAQDPVPCMAIDDEDMAAVRPRPILNYSQRRIVNLRKNFKLTLGATNAILELFVDPRFDPQELGTARVQCLENRLLRGYGGDVRAYDFHTEEDGKQDLMMYLRCALRVMEEIFSDPRLKDYLILTFTPTFDADGRTFGSAMGGLWAQFQMRAIKNGSEVLLALAVHIDASYVKVNLSVKPAYGILPMLV